jgi:hypothetical protein
MQLKYNEDKISQVLMGRELDQVFAEHSFSISQLNEKLFSSTILTVPVFKDQI